MRVVIVGSLPPPWGGVVTHVRELERALREHGVKTEILDPRRRGPDGRDGRPRLLARLLRARLSGELVHVHTNGHNRKSWLLALACGLGRPSLLTIHSGLSPPFIRAHAALVRATCARHAVVIAVNSRILDALVYVGVPAETVVTCPAFSPGQLGLKLSPPGLAAFRRRHDPLLACALGNAPEYGADVLLDAFARVASTFPKAGLVAYGAGTRSPEFVRQLAALPLGGAVQLYDELSRPRALAVVDACDLFVRPSRADGDALSIREALCLGRPVVASDVVHRPEGVVLFASGDSSELAEKIFHSLGNPGPASAPQVDCLPALLSLYQRCGVELGEATLGTPLAAPS